VGWDPARGRALVVATASILTGCSLLVGDDLAGGDDSPADAGTARDADVGPPRDDASTPPPDAGSDADVESGIVVHGFSKTPRVTTRSLAVVRPTATKEGDIIVVAVRWIGTFYPGQFKPLLETRGCVPRPDGGLPDLAGFLWFGYRVATAADPATWSVGSSNDAPGEVVVVAIGGSNGTPLDDSKGQVNPAGTAESPSVMVQSVVSRLLIGFSSPGPVAWPTPAGLTPVTSTESLALFTTVLPAGASPAYAMPPQLTTTCSIGAAIALPPK
jgi:hypothetical protein